MKRQYTLAAAVFLLNCLLGCASFSQSTAYQPTPYQPPVWSCIPTQATVENDYSIVTISPIKAQFSWYSGFKLTVENKTECNLELNWNKTLYVHNGQTSGGFMFDGVQFINRNAPKLPDIVFPKSTLSKIIYPCTLAEYLHTWFFNPMKVGENGVFLTIVKESKELSSKVVLNVKSS